MTKDNIYYYNHETAEEIIREMTDEEQAQRDADVAAYLAEKQAKEQAEAEARALKISAYHKLGLSEAEIEALLPTPQIDAAP
jgi:Holliday junction resolvasome RuvABC DNA-binding subunit